MNLYFMMIFFKWQEIRWNVFLRMTFLTVLLMINFSESNGLMWSGDKSSSWLPAWWVLQLLWWPLAESRGSNALLIFTMCFCYCFIIIFYWQEFSNMASDWLASCQPIRSHVGKSLLTTWILAWTCLGNPASWFHRFQPIKSHVRKFLWTHGFCHAFSQ